MLTKKIPKYLDSAFSREQPPPKWNQNRYDVGQGPSRRRTSIWKDIQPTVSTNSPAVVPVTAPAVIQEIIPEVIPATQMQQHEFEVVDEAFGIGLPCRHAQSVDPEGRGEVSRRIRRAVGSAGHGCRGDKRGKCQAAISSALSYCSIWSAAFCAAEKARITAFGLSLIPRIQPLIYLA